LRWKEKNLKKFIQDPVSDEDERFPPTSSTTLTLMNQTTGVACFLFTFPQQHKNTKTQNHKILVLKQSFGQLTNITGAQYGTLART